MQTKTFATLLCLSALSSATAWSMQPGARLAAIAARRSVSRRTCMTSLKPGVRQFPNGGTARKFSSHSTNASDTAATLAFFFAPLVLGSVMISIPIVRVMIKERIEHEKDLREFANNPDPSGKDSPEIRRRKRIDAWTSRVLDVSPYC